MIVVQLDLNVLNAIILLLDVLVVEKQVLNILVQNVVLKVRIKMADVVITLKIMPCSPDTNLDELEAKVMPLIAKFGGEVGKKEIEPIAFGLKALKLYFVMSEDIGSTDDLEAEISKLDEVEGVEIADVRRAVG
jgi:elongation factor 1-beta